MIHQRNFINNGSELYLYADNTKVYRYIKDHSDMEKLQTDINEMKKWSERWLLFFYPTKCKFMRIGTMRTDMDDQHEEATAEKGIEVITDKKLNFSDHLAEKINKANRMVELIRRTLIALDEEIFKALWVALVRLASHERIFFRTVILPRGGCQ